MKKQVYKFQNKSNSRIFVSGQKRILKQISFNSNKKSD